MVQDLSLKYSLSMQLKLSSAHPTKAVQTMCLGEEKRGTKRVAGAEAAGKESARKGSHTAMGRLYLKGARRAQG